MVSCDVLSRSDARLLTPRRSFLPSLEVSVSFESGTSVTYTFQEAFSVIQNSSRQSSAIYAQSSKSRENVAFRFLTTKSPAMLMTVTTYQQQYMAIILAHNGTRTNMLTRNRHHVVFLYCFASFASLYSTLRQLVYPHLLLFVVIH